MAYPPFPLTFFAYPIKKCIIWLKKYSVTVSSSHSSQNTGLPDRKWLKISSKAIKNYSKQICSFNNFKTKLFSIFFFLVYRDNIALDDSTKGHFLLNCGLKNCFQSKSVETNMMGPIKFVFYIAENDTDLNQSFMISNYIEVNLFVITENPL